MYRMKFPYSVTVEPKTAENASHNVTYGTSKTVKCNYQLSVQDIEGNSGSVLADLAWIAFPPETSISFGDRITLPDSSQPKMISLAPRYSSVTHEIVYWEVYLSKVGNV